MLNWAGGNQFKDRVMTSLSKFTRIWLPGRAARPLNLKKLSPVFKSNFLCYLCWIRLNPSILSEDLEWWVGITERQKWKGQGCIASSFISCWGLSKHDQGILGALMLTRCSFVGVIAISSSGAVGFQCVLNKAEKKRAFRGLLSPTPEVVFQGGHLEFGEGWFQPLDGTGSAPESRWRCTILPSSEGGSHLAPGSQPSSGWSGD